MHGMGMAVVWMLSAAGLAAASGIVFAPEPEEEANKYKLPEGFLFGAGTSSYQTEGAWNENGKGINVFDHYFNIEGHNPNPEKNGNIAADTYHHIDDDIEMIRRLKLQVYRFSISWSRLIPDGNASNPNPDGIRYYNELIDKLRSINVEPLITLYHFAHPQVLHEKHDSWLGRGMIEDFVRYADFAFQTFEDRVKYWASMNEPTIYCYLVYRARRMAPGISGAPHGSAAYYTCLHHLLLAHGRAYRVYKATQKGKFGISCVSTLSRPNSTSYEDIQAAVRASALGLGLCAAPVVFGDYPEIAIKQMEKKRKQYNLQTSNLPKFTEQEKAMMKDSIDFLGLNVYGAQTVIDGTSKLSQSVTPDILTDGDSIVVPEPDTTNTIQQFKPWFMRHSLLYARDNFNNVPIFITESGCAEEANEGIHDQSRAAYHSVYMRTMIETMQDGGLNVLGMTVWTLMDDFEWSSAYDPKYGLVQIDYSSPNRTRTLKDSSAFFIKLMTERRVPLVKSITGTSSASAASPSASASQLLVGSAVGLLIIKLNT